MTPADIHAELFEQSVRGFFFERGCTAAAADEWTDAIVAIAADHPPAACPHAAYDTEGMSYCTLAPEPAGTLGEARSLLDAWCAAAEDGEALGPLREQTLGWLG